MSRIDEIERALENLSDEEFAQIARRIHALEQERWEKELDGDATAGKLDFLRDEARSEREKQLSKDWPPKT
jgi:hypothetical protein